MHTNTLALPQRLPSTWRWLIALLAALAVALGAAYSAQAASIPAITCTGTPMPRNYDLHARTGGVLTLADGTQVNIWGYTTDSNPPAVLGGPTLVACDGDTVTITLYNELGENSSLAVHGQTLPADTVGIASGSKPYAFIAHAGTFVYQAGLTVNGPKQAALGLYGALVVYPTTAATAYNSEALVLLSEIDPALNGVVPAPVNASFDMQDYAPKYWLINGKSYPQTDPIQAPAGSKVLLRYANAGFNEHSMSLLGLDQSIIAANGYLSPFAHGAVAETVPPGSTMDAIITMPITAGGQYPLYDANQHIDNNGSVSASGLGGMFTFVKPTAGAAASFTVSCPATATAGTAVNCTVTAVDTYGNTATGYVGIAHFTSSDVAATLPTDQTLTLGTATVAVTFNTAGAQTVTATDTVAASITGTSASVTVAAGVAASFTVSCPATATAGTPVNCTVTAIDAYNNTVTGYAGTVTFTSSDVAATLPADQTLTLGTATVAVTFNTAGAQTVTATDTVTASIIGVSGAVAVSL